MAHKGQPPQDIYHSTIGPDGRITESMIATGVCFCCKTAVAVDARGAVYAAWRHIFPGSMRDIAFAKSIDGGKHFSPLVRVSEDKWELNGCPEDGPTSGGRSVRDDPYCLGHGRQRRRAAESSVLRDLARWQNILRACQTPG